MPKKELPKEGLRKKKNEGKSAAETIRLSQSLAEKKESPVCFSAIAICFSYGKKLREKK